MIDTAKPLDPLRLPLRDERLIEASAGTGKTFTIITLYLRLLLGLGGNSAFPRPLNVEDLLLVTFTEAATAELRGRIRSNIRAFRIACLRQSTDNPLFERLMDEIANKQQAAQYLLLAERKMDKAAIFTIHSFCQRMLSLYTFETGSLYEQKLTKDESELRYQACADFWRRNCYPLSRDIAEVVYSQWKGPKALLCAIDRYLNGEMPSIKSPPPKNETLAARHEKIVSQIVEVKKKWCESSSDIRIVIEKSGIDRRKFQCSNQEKWIEKINAWAKEETRNYQLPDALRKFSQRFLAEQTKPDGIVPEHPVFIAIDELLAKPLTLNDLILVRAMTEIRETIAREKRCRGELGFDDMISRLDEALSSKNGEMLAAAIRARFPIAMIDEFQDTDPQQYRIFRRIWHWKSETALLLIGDPKQAIYAFRGADIFTYIKARGEVKAHYTLDTNWRSSPGIVSSVNTLFSRMDEAFIFHEIPFLPVKSADKNANLRFECHGKTQPAMRFYLMDGEGYGVKDYQIFMANQAAAQIRDWLNAGVQGEALLWRDEISQPIKGSDITVLVRSRQEAALVRDALTLFGISSIYLSNRDSVFDTLEAKEMLWLLQAVLSPGQESTLRRALASSILGLTALDIDFFNNDEPTWDAVVKEFTDYRERWKKCGIIAMLRELMARRQIAENMLATSGGERRFTDFLHLSELLQEASSQLESESALIRWLMQHIAEPNHNSVDQQMRLESDKHLVQIVTLHKSKGLEYPLIWLPFIANYRTQDQAFYHDPVSFEPTLDLSQAKESIELAEIERLAEDLRLLYVALTRSVWHCSLGVAPLFRRRGEKTGKTDFHRSAIGRLIQKGEAKDATGLRLALEGLCNEHITLHIPDLPDNSCFKLAEPVSPMLEARKIYRTIVDDWRVTSYSELQQDGKSIQSIVQDLVPNLDVDTKETREAKRQPRLTLHQFPRGSSSGTFLHRLFEKLDFSQPVSVDWVLEMLQKGGYEPWWQPVLSEWITAILRIPLTDSDITLSHLSMKERLVEMEFYLPVGKQLKAKALDSLIRKHDPLSRRCSSLDFRPVSGMLKGFIDLVFRYEDRYYLLDYKSNRLGENSEAYTHEAVVATMCSHRYDLQYQLYTLALHRYLRHRIADYRYENHFGGVIYLFIRGIDALNQRSGVFTTRPKKVLIEDMDRLFTASA